MFIRQALTVAVPIAVAQDRLAEFFRSDGVEDASCAAYNDGGGPLVRAGFAGVSKRVSVCSLPPYQRGDAIVIAFSWYATGPLGDLFPPLDADLELNSAEDGQTTLTVVGVYRPPAGRLGASLDQLLLHRVAAATIDGFLTRLAAVTTQPDTATAPELRSRPTIANRTVIA